MVLGPSGSQVVCSKNGGGRGSKFFYPRLVRHVTSGPVIAMRVSGDVRSILGSSRLYPIPEIGVRSSLRQRYALSDVRNVAHTSDADAAQRELAIFEPFLPPEPLLKEILTPNIGPSFL
ncbi:nucleoside diphosphate kinase, partial [Cooperia oncophora]